MLWCLGQVPQLRDIAPVECAWVEDESIVPRDFIGEPRFMHGNLHPEHIIVDRLTGRLSGIVDWGRISATPRTTLNFS